MQCFSRITFNEHQTESPLLFAKSKTTKKKKKKKRKRKKKREKKERIVFTLSLAQSRPNCG